MGRPQRGGSTDGWNFDSGGKTRVEILESFRPSTEAFLPMRHARPMKTVQSNTHTPLEVIVSRFAYAAAAAMKAAAKNANDKRRLEIMGSAYDSAGISHAGREVTGPWRQPSGQHLP